LKHRIAICAGLAALGVAGATSAQAQPIYTEPPRGYVAVSPPTVEPMVEGLPPQEILMIVRASGLRPLTQPARRGGRYLILASDNMGGQLRVVVNAHTGRIVDASPVHDPRFGDPPMRPRGLVPTPGPQEAEAPSAYEPPPSDLRNPSAPPPPARVARTTPAPQTPPAERSSSHSRASAPDITGSTTPARPARTPLPRPRPAQATQQAAAPAPAAEAATSPAPQAVRETSPEAEQPAATPAPAAPSAAPATPPASETQMVPVAPLD
jgi:hypothetical protein